MSFRSGAAAEEPAFRVRHPTPGRSPRPVCRGHSCPRDRRHPRNQPASTTNPESASPPLSPSHSSACTMQTEFSPVWRRNQMRFKLLLALAAITAPALAQTPHSEIETNILALETAWTQAQTSRNTQTLSTLLADNFVYTGYTGAVMTKKEFLADLKDGSYAPTLVVNQNHKVVSYNHAAVVTGV